MTSGDRDALWRPADRVAVGLGNVAGAAVMMAAYAGASHQAIADRQIGWVNLGIAGLLVVTVANTGWLLAGRRACWRLRHALLPARPGAAWPSARAALAPAASGAGLPSIVGTASLPPGAAGLPVAAAAMTWYHSPGCRMVAGKEVSPSPLAEHLARGRRPCAICLPADDEAAQS